MCTDKRRPFFGNPDVVNLVLSHFLQTAHDQDMEIPAYCFMPDHMHALVSGRDAGSDFRRFVALAKQRSGYVFARARQSRLWQEGYYDRALRQEETAVAVVAYLIENPVRAGLVEHVEHYPYWGSSIWTRDELLELVQTRRGPPGLKPRPTAAETRRRRSRSAPARRRTGEWE